MALLINIFDLTEGNVPVIPKTTNPSEENGSPEGLLDAEKDRSFFYLTFPIHPEYLAPTKVRNKTNKTSKK